MSRLEVGTELPSRSVLITEEYIHRYGIASHDDNPIHRDGTAARNSGLPGIIAHGMLSMGVLGSRASAWAGGSQYVRGMSCRFVNIVRPGDTLTFAGTVGDIVDGVVTAGVSVTNHRGEEVLAKAIVEFELQPPDIMIA